MGLKRQQCFEDKKPPNEDPIPVEDPPLEEDVPEIEDPSQNSREPKRLRLRVMIVPCAQMMNAHNVNVLLERVSLPLTCLN